VIRVRACVCQVHGLAQQQGLIVLNKSAPGVSSAPGGGTADPQAALVQQLRLQQLIQQQQHGAVGGAGGGATVQLRPTTANQYTAQQPTQQQVPLLTPNYYYTRLTALSPGLPVCASTRKVKPVWILLKQETVSGSGTTGPHASLHLAPDR